MNEIEYIAKNPKYGKDFSDVRKDYFRTQIKSHFIFYKVNSKQKEVEIVRVLHQRMDIENRLNE
ncbi:MAG: type II toxin-antitoxin system RelE/ParE family toxin [Chitinophagales bacterium]|nr:type II toxin-antitoxin system RelE/ParE family toxin [Chitinophagales bacterium]